MVSKKADVILGVMPTVPVRTIEAKGETVRRRLPHVKLVNLFLPPQKTFVRVPQTLGTHFLRNVKPYWLASCSSHYLAQTIVKSTTRSFIL